MSQPENSPPSDPAPEAGPPADIVVLFKALADEHRIKIAAQIMDKGLTVEEIAAGSGLEPRIIGRHLGSLVDSGLAEREGTGQQARFRFQKRRLHEAFKGLGRQRRELELGEDVADFDRKILNTFLVDGRLITIPAQQKKRDVILRFLADRFERDRMYDEREVNALLREYHDDVASLRRYLVDGEFLRRQVVRVADMDSLMDGAPEIELRVSYWRP